MAQVDHRDQNRRLTGIITRAVGRLGEFYPFYPFVEIKEENQALYLQFDKPLPPGRRHVAAFRTRGEAYLPDGAKVEWEMLEARDHGRWGWRRLHARLVVGLLYAFFRWTTGIEARSLPPAEATLVAQGFSPAGLREYRGGLIRSVWFRRAISIRGAHSGE